MGRRDFTCILRFFFYKTATGTERVNGKGLVEYAIEIKDSRVVESHGEEFNNPVTLDAVSVLPRRKRKPYYLAALHRRRFLKEIWNHMFTFLIKTQQRKNTIQHAYKEAVL